ncbi:MAG: hypothetical protein AAGA63_05740 [Pseudomonadota bacterium]
MRTLLGLTLLIVLTSCGPRETSIEREDDLVLVPIEEEEEDTLGILNLPDRSDPVLQGRVYGELAQTVDSLRLDRTADGVIVVATTRAGPDAIFDVSLRPLNQGFPDSDGFMSFEFRYDTTQDLRALSGERELTAARYISLARLEGVRGIRVFAAENNRSINQ